MPIVGRLDQYASMLATEFDETTANNPSITGLGTYYASEFNENIQESIVTSGLILNLDAGNTASYSGSGSTWTDISGSGNSATLVSSPIYDSANGGSIVFNGTSNYATVPIANPGTSAVTFEFWINSAANNPNGIFDSAPGSPNVLRNFAYFSGPGYLAWWDDDPIINMGVVANTWYQIVGVYRLSPNRVIDLYRNGVYIASATSGNTSGYAWSGFRLGHINGSFSAGYSYSGKLAKFAIYNRALTAAEVSQNYNALAGRYGLSSTSLPMSANIFSPYDLVSGDFGGTLFGAGQGRYMRQNTDKSVIVYNEIDEVTDFYGRGNIVRDGLVLDLDAGVPDSYPGTGTTWTDLSGNTANSTFGASTAAPTYSSDGGGSIVFDGVNDLVSVPTTSLYDFSASRVTIEVWIKATSTPTGNNLILTTDSSGDPSTWNLGFVSGVLCFIPTGWQQSGGAGTAPRMSISNFTLNTWNHVVVTSAGNGEVGKLYFNGVSQINGSSTTIGLSYDAGRPLGIGLEPTTGRFPFNGRIGVVRIYKNKTFTQQEVSQNFDALRGRYGL